MKTPHIETVKLEKIVGGGQALGQLADGRKLFVWGGLPGEVVTVRLTKKKKNFAEGIVTEVHASSAERITPRDPDSYISTSPWQIMDFATEQRYKAALIEEAFALHDIVLPQPVEVKTDQKQYEYRNKVEFSFWWDKDAERVDLAFFQRGGHGKIPVESTSLAMPSITSAAREILRLLRTTNTEGRDLKTLLIRASQRGEVSAQLYIKDRKAMDAFKNINFSISELTSFEIIYSDPRSPASVITEKLMGIGKSTLHDTILDTPFRYATEGFFQVNIPLYETALRDMQQYISPDRPVVDMYSGVGSIGLTIGGKNPTLVEISDYAVQEMRRNIKALGKHATVVHASSETTLEHISSDATIILDPPRAGLHEKVVGELLAKKPHQLIYLSCNPVTQARDVMRLAEEYGVRAHVGYNFFPRTPHIEHLVVLEPIPNLPPKPKPSDFESEFVLEEET